MPDRQILKIRYVALLAASLWVGGVFPSVAQDDPYKDIHSIGVISALGHEVTLQNIGSTRLTNSAEKTSLDWDIDNQALQLLSGALRGKFAVKQVSASADRLRELVLGSDFPDRTDVPKYLQSLPSSNEVDAYLVVLPGRNWIPAVYARYEVEGFGVIRKENMFSSSVPVTPYAAYDVLVVDAKSGKFIAWSYGSLSESRAHSGTMASLCKSDIRVKSAAELTEAQKAIIRDELKFLVFSSLPNALKHVGLPSSLDVSGIMPVRPSICMSP